MPSNKMNLWSPAAALLIILGAVETVTAAWNDALNGWDTVGLGHPVDVNGDTAGILKFNGVSASNQGACQTACTTNYGTTLQGYSWGGILGCVCWTGVVAIHSVGGVATYGTVYCLDCLNPTTSERSPSLQPSESFQPSESSQPSLNPSQSFKPSESSKPSLQPSGSLQPSESSKPSETPSLQPSETPSLKPSESPSLQPSESPSLQPSETPSIQPSKTPSLQPSEYPSLQPSLQPSKSPSLKPSESPSLQPSGTPSLQPSESLKPSESPSLQPSESPSLQPNESPSLKPSKTPSGEPSLQPSQTPSLKPSEMPSLQPSESPSLQPSLQPSKSPSLKPSETPSLQPSELPSLQPSDTPSLQPSESLKPSEYPSLQPSESPSLQPSETPSLQPSKTPSGQPSLQPSKTPSRQPSETPSGQPSLQPSQTPSLKPSETPSLKPSLQPSGHPSLQPSKWPSLQPSKSPSLEPSESPSLQPTTSPSLEPTPPQPSAKPSVAPSGRPSRLCVDPVEYCGIGGLWSPYTCECLCLAPRCPGDDGSCTSTSCAVDYHETLFDDQPEPWFSYGSTCTATKDVPSTTSFVYFSKEDCCKVEYSQDVSGCVARPAEVQQLAYNGIFTLTGLACPNNGSARAATAGNIAQAILGALCTGAGLTCTASDRVAVTRFCSQDYEIEATYDDSSRRRLQTFDRTDNTVQWTFYSTGLDYDTLRGMSAVLDSYLSGTSLTTFLAAVLTNIQSSNPTASLVAVTALVYEAVNAFIAGLGLYYPAWGYLETCISDGEQEPYMNRDHSKWLYDTLDGCCQRYYGWDPAGCQLRNAEATLVSGAIGKVIQPSDGLYFPDWGKTDTCINDGTAPSYMAKQHELWMYSTLGDCCRAYYGWEGGFVECMSSSGLPAPTQSPIGETWYVIWNDFKCVKSCEGNVAPCGGLHKPWDNPHSSKAECCAARMPWILMADCMAK